ncbi:hypothetical protein CASFOL_034541 [Castilleja foliolosa]|uniref:Pectin acetylesterase n=1 Tax=Castilleja foliolosa TaxID=1961234 RepID=A0ABD3BR83_9LAMI
MEKNIQTMADHLLKLVICLIVVMNTHQVRGHNYCLNKVNITYVSDAVEKGAVCNDGSPAAYYYSPGFGEGATNWLIHLNGGGWCFSDAGCMGRFKDGTGSSKNNPQTNYFGAVTSANQSENPDFYNWNRVMVVYCDGSSFMGITDHPNVASRGARIFDAVMEELLQKGMATATNAVFSGGSAGGLAALLHCDGYRALLPASSRVKCVIDSGFFIHAPKLHGAEKRLDRFANVSAYHGFTDKLPPSCTSRMNASLCMFPEYIIKDIQTPLFLVESKFDQYQMTSHNIRDDYKTFKKCTDNLTLCTPTDFQSMKDYGVAVTKLMQQVGDYSPSISMFVHPCIRHGHFYENSGWGKSYVLQHKTIAQAVGDWFYDRCNPFQAIDLEHEFPLNCTTLTNM